jgi:HYR domain
MTQRGCQQPIWRPFSVGRLIGVQSLTCNPPSGSIFPVGTTTVTCTATDASGNTAQYTFNVTVYSFCLQDETKPDNFVLINPATGEYAFFCNGVLIAGGKGTLTVKGCEGTIEHPKGDRRVLIAWDTTANGGKGAGTASVQVPVNNTRCQITDKDMSNNTCAASGPVAVRRENAPRE